MPRWDATDADRARACAGLPAVAWDALAAAPIRLDLTVASVASAPYVQPDPTLAARWHREIERHGSGLRVGVCWSAGAPDAQGRGRSLPLAALAPLARVSGCTFYALQKTVGEWIPPSGVIPEAEPSPPGLELVRLRPRFEDMADTAAAIAPLDLVVTCDTSVGHLAGALGARTWMLPSWPTCRRSGSGSPSTRSPVRPARRRYEGARRRRRPHRRAGPHAEAGAPRHRGGRPSRGRGRRAAGAGRAHAARSRARRAVTPA